MDRFKSSIVAVALLIGGVAEAQPANRYAIDAAASEIYWQVYKAGALSRFGHNHVISVAKLEGHVHLADQAAESWFEMTIPVADLVIDDPALREAKGEDFESVPSEEDIAGTQRNMLSETVLNGEQFPELRVTGRNLTAFSSDAAIDLTIAILGREVQVTVPVAVELADGELVASGAFSMNHADLGMEPFSVMMGALQVGEQLDFFFRIRATPSN